MGMFVFLSSLHFTYAQDKNPLNPVGGAMDGGGIIYFKNILNCDGQTPAGKSLQFSINAVLKVDQYMGTLVSGRSSALFDCQKKEQTSTANADQSVKIWSCTESQTSQNSQNRKVTVFSPGLAGKMLASLTLEKKRLGSLICELAE